MDELEPSEFYLAQNYPNPFKGKTVIKYCVAYKTQVRITVYNNEGEMIEKIIDEEKKPGTYEVEFSQCHSRESGNLSEEIYSYCLEAGEYINEKKMVLEK